jgi:hypothetical protein
MLMSRNLISTLFISLDGVVEAPQEWHFPYFNDEMADGEKHALELVDSRTFGTGVVYATYTPQASAGGS